MASVLRACVQDRPTADSTLSGRSDSQSSASTSPHCASWSGGSRFAPVGAATCRGVTVTSPAGLNASRHGRRAAASRLRCEAVSTGWGWVPNWIPNPWAGNRTEKETPVLEDVEVQNLGWPAFDATNFALGGVLGRGSYGTVFAATERATGEAVAIKKLCKTRRKLERSRVLEKLEREASIMREARLLSPVAVGLRSKSEDMDNVYLVMEQVTGGTLEGVLDSKTEKLSEAEVLHVGRNVLNMLAALHAAKILYGDVKPANFMYGGEDSAVRAIDFGCSQREPKDVYFRSRSGTPAYFAPEVYRKCYSYSADIWSLGIMMYQMVTGRFPWWSDATYITPRDVMDKVMYHSIPFNEDEWNHVSPELLDLVSSLLAHNPANRPTARDALHHRVFDSSHIPVDNVATLSVANSIECDASEFALDMMSDDDEDNELSF